MSDNTYNGWANRETWLVNLWLSNEQGSNDSCIELARVMARKGFPNIMIGEAIEEQILDEWMSESSGFALDVWNAFKARVDWREIGAAFRLDDGKDSE